MWFKATFALGMVGHDYQMLIRFLPEYSKDKRRASVVWYHESTVLYRAAIRYRVMVLTFTTAFDFCKSL